MRVHLPLQQGLRPASARQNHHKSVACASASSITTRIKTVRFDFENNIKTKVRVHLPLQQGLRLVLRASLFSHQVGASASSITTRIKTPISYSGIFVRYYSASASSITTRIKTRYMWMDTMCRPLVRVHLPLQQGLRRSPVSNAPIAFNKCECIFHYNKD